MFAQELIVFSPQVGGGVGLGAFVLSIQGQDTREGSQGDACPSGARDLTIYLEPDGCSLIKSELCGRVRGWV